MALVIQTIVADSDYVPYERPPDPVTLWTAIPRGLLSFIVASQALDLKLINDDQLLQITGTLPENYAYVVQECNFTINTTGAGFWNDRCNLNLQGYYRGSTASVIALAGNFLSDFSDNELFNGSKTLCRNGAFSTPWPRLPIVGTPGFGGIQFNFSAGNDQDPATAAGVVQFNLSFWQYDLEQIRKFPINMAIHTI